MWHVAQTSYENSSARGCGESRFQKTACGIGEQALCPQAQPHADERELVEHLDVASHPLHAEALFWAEGKQAAASQDEGPHRNIPMRPLSSESDVADYLRVAR